MNRRGFLKFLGVASVGATVAYSFPSVIVPQNIIIPSEYFATDPVFDVLSELNRVTIEEIYPRLILDVFFTKTPFDKFVEARIFQGGKEVHSRILVAADIN